MMLLGLAVFAVAFRRFIIGSAPRPMIMIVLGVFALGASLMCSAIVLRRRGTATTPQAVWKLSGADAVSNIAVMAAGTLVALTSSNIPDLVIGGAMAGYFALLGWRMAASGQAYNHRAP